MEPKYGLFLKEGITAENCFSKIAKSFRCPYTLNSNTSNKIMYILIDRSKTLNLKINIRNDINFKTPS